MKHERLQRHLRLGQLNYISCGILWRIFCQTGTFRGVFSIIISYIYLGYFVCLCVIECVCVSQFVAERSAFLFVLVIKLTKRRDGGFGEGGIRDGEIGKGQIEEGGCEETFHFLSLT